MSEVADPMKDERERVWAAVHEHVDSELGPRQLLDRFADLYEHDDKVYAGMRLAIAQPGSGAQRIDAMKPWMHALPDVPRDQVELMVCAIMGARCIGEVQCMGRHETALLIRKVGEDMIGILRWEQS
ncbi:hypothetical protein F8O06_04985 [Pseudoclavibacter sp. CFCC 14310]|uniref:hypothetical protein n=1 Tax=Pseudoclavibacter sp. CFCC 14310 TaxID=2615180 RepID=UPI0013017512|nr:hypothetical protein [Pseudoclavibacter sp. CFCC 14310]KAB1645421.1 hypothetical protein F8O06_07460 [Pseudoclavibacter sp. CFCC 14310]KAB1646120.1 hypothetical protein F8O06_04985 [Pseudoclavibacter sp. CFCC 14310]